jgi:cyclic lactone autoinducer peptide
MECTKIKNTKKSICNLIAKVCLTSAKHTASSTSLFGTYQPKEPANLKERIAKIEKK